MTGDTPICRTLFHRVDGPYSAFALRLPAGSQHDPSGASGTAHLIEHLIMRSESSRLRESYATFLARVGAEHTIVTSREAIELAVAVPSARLADVLDVTLNVVRHPDSIHRGDDTDDERAVIRDEIRRHSSDPRDVAMLRTAIRLLISSSSSFCLSPLGSEAEIVRIGASEVQGFAEAHLDLRRARLGVVSGKPAVASWQEVGAEAEQSECLALRPHTPEPLVHVDEWEGRRMIAFRLPRQADPTYDQCVRALRVIASLLPRGCHPRLSVLPFETRSSIGAFFHSEPSSAGGTVNETPPDTMLRALSEASIEFLRIAAARSRFQDLRQNADLRERARRLARGQTLFSPRARGCVDELDRAGLLRELGVDDLTMWLPRVAPSCEQRVRA